MLPNANFATPQVFKVIASITPTPVIAWTDPLATTSIIAGITTFTRCIPSAVTIPLSVNGLPAGSTTTYQWYNAITNLPIPGANGSTYTISAVGNYSVYVYTTTTSSPYIAPGCRVKSKKVNVIINNCPCTPLQCSNASLMGVSVATRINSGGSWPTLNTVVGSGIELPSCGPTLGMAGAAPRWDIDFNSNTIHITCLQDATYGGSFFNFSNIIPTAVLGCPTPVISSITVTTNHPLTPFNVITAATFTQNTVYIYFAPNSGTLIWKQGHYINVQLNYGCP
ncbi:MAG: hypothetical protein IPP52_16270 [Ignavibacteria bacterium]|nr:hypothetical protein [Ignavibacteria bacterium]